MFENFLNSNSSVIGRERDSRSIATFVDISINNLFNECGGLNFGKGLYRVHSHSTSIYWTSIIGNYFNNYKDQIVPFGFDWMGRQFAVDLRRTNQLLMFDPSTAEAFELNQNLTSFHNEDLVHDQESFLSKLHFQEVINTLKIKEVKFDECIGFKVPLFLSGKDEIANLEITDIEVYWEMQCQIYLQIKDLPPGTKISSVKFE